MDVVLRAPGILAITVIGAAVVIYGYEIFNLHIGLDEEISLTGTDSPQAWLAQGRWAMAGFHAVLLAPVTPVVSVSIGVIGVATALLIVCAPICRSRARQASLSSSRSVYKFGRWHEFATLSYGVGVASLSVASAFWLAINAHGRIPRVVAPIVLAVIAVGCYQPFAFVLPLLALAMC